MKRSVRDTKEKLYKDSLRLRLLANEIGGEKSFEIRCEQDKMYKKWLFYSNIMKASDKIKGDK